MVCNAVTNLISRNRGLLGRGCLVTDSLLICSSWSVLSQVALGLSLCNNWVDCYDLCMQLHIMR